MDRGDLIKAVADYFHGVIDDVSPKNLLENDSDIHKAIEDPDTEDGITEQELKDCINAISEGLQITLDVLRERVDF